MHHNSRSNVHIAEAVGDDESEEMADVENDKLGERMILYFRIWSLKLKIDYNTGSGMWTKRQVLHAAQIQQTANQHQISLDMLEGTQPLSLWCCPGACLYICPDNPL
jgi:hypothetical protein